MKQRNVFITVGISVTSATFNASPSLERVLFVALSVYIVSKCWLKVLIKDFVDTPNKEFEILVLLIFMYSRSSISISSSIHMGCDTNLVLL